MQSPSKPLTDIRLNILLLISAMLTESNWTLVYKSWYLPAKKNTLFVKNSITHQYSTHNATKLHVILHKSISYGHSLGVRGMRLWNSCPVNNFWIDESLSIYIFKKNCKISVIVLIVLRQVYIVYHFSYFSLIYIFIFCRYSLCFLVTVLHICYIADLLPSNNWWC